MYTYTVSPKRKYTLLSSWVLIIEGGQMKGRGCAKPNIELVQTGPSLILKFKEMAADQQKSWRDPIASDFLFLCRHLLEFQNEALSSLDQLNSGCVAPPTFPLAYLGF